jgi:RecA/RadA recombinase
MSRPFVVEVMGPAGSGKTTLVRTLCSKSNGVRAGVGIGRVRYIRPLITTVSPLVPLWLRAYREDRWLNRREALSMAWLEAWHRELERRTPLPEAATVFDHGPVYRLALLREFGPRVTGSQRFERWWRSMRTRWLATLDLVVSLDAPDGVLLQRLESRGHWYLSADLAIDEKHAFLARFRGGFSRVLASAEGDGPRIVTFRSDQRSVSEIADGVLAALGTTPMRPIPAEGSAR